MLVFGGVRYEKVWTYYCCQMDWCQPSGLVFQVHQYSLLYLLGWAKHTSHAPILRCFRTSGRKGRRSRCWVWMNFVTFFKGSTFWTLLYPWRFWWRNGKKAWNMFKKRKQRYSKVLDTEFPKRFADSIKTSDFFWSQELLVLMKILWALPKPLVHSG